MPQRSNQPVHRRPEAVATLAPPDPAAAERLLATLADVAIDQMLAPPRKRVPPKGPPRAVEPVQDVEVRLSPEEHAALRMGEDVDDPPAGLWPYGEEEGGVAAGLCEAAETTTAMPTDEELEALLREPGESPAPARGRRAPTDCRAQSPNVTDAVAQLAAELDEELAPPRARPLEPTLPSRGPMDLADDDGDAIQAEGAIEARGSVNLAEPVVFHESLSLAPGVMAAVPGEQPAARKRCPWWLLPLVWMNAPLSGAPQSVRQTIGKAAVLTLLNAAAVLVYVLVLRR